MQPRSLPVLRFTTAGLPPDRQFEAFADAAGAVFAVDRLHPAPRAGFVAEMTAWGFGDLLLRRVSSDGPLRSTRTPLAIRRDQMDHWAISAWRSGTNRGEVAGQGFDMQPGHIYPYSLAAPGRWERSTAAWNMLIIPRDALPELAGAFDAQVGRSAQLPLGPLVWSHIDALDGALARADAAQGAELAAATLAMLRALLGGGDAREAALPLLQETRRRRVLALIRAHLGSARLTPGRLAALAGTSRTRLYLLFEAEGGVARVIQRERLAAVAAALSDAEEQRPIAALAEAFGMPDASVFSRAFRRAYDMTPGEFRLAARLGAVPRLRPQAGASTLARLLPVPGAGLGFAA
jgi:AraC-like DNA-binding protein